jgi:hypothetical protein
VVTRPFGTWSAARALCGVIPSGSGCIPRSSTSRCAWATAASTTSWRRLCRERAVPVAVSWGRERGCGLHRCGSAPHWDRAGPVLAPLAFTGSQQSRRGTL